MASLRKRILVVGLTCVDIKNVVEHYPVEDQDIRAISQTWTVGGNAANTAHILAQHKNVQIDLLSGLSSRKEHQFVIDELLKSSINIEHCVYHDFLLPTSTCILNQETGSRTILCCRNEFPELSVHDFTQINILDYDWIHFEGRDFPAVGEMIQYIIKTRPTTNKPVVSGEMEKVKRLEDLESHLLPFVDVLLISKDIALHIKQKTALDTVVSITKRKLAAKVVICPWDDKGAAVGELSDSEWMFHECDACQVDVVDSLGAGDTFNAAVIISLLYSSDSLLAIQYGCKLASKKCAQIGFEKLI